MDLFDALHTRRSVRSFTDAKVSLDQIRTLLDAAMIAPSAGNQQPWRFVVVVDPAILARVPQIHPYAGMARNASAGILVCGDTRAEKHPGFWVQDCSAAIQNLLLAAVGIGLGAVWTGIHPVPQRVDAFQDLFSLPGDVIPLALVLIGQSETPQARKSRYDDAKVYYNQWGRETSS